VLVCNVPTAVPGRSNHGWGRAIDVVDTTGRRASVLSCSDPQFEWLVENGPTFGWVLPSWARCNKSTAEPWHWEWAGLTGPLSQLIVEQRAARGLAIPL
jgi:LAS superfamily LD-carboxypeptidase LdcB